MRRYAALSGGGLFALLLLTSTVTLAAPPAFAQVETVTGLERHPTIGFDDEGPLIENTYVKQQDGYTWEVDIETGELYKLHEQTSVDFADQPDYPNVEPTSTVVQNDDGSFTMTTHNEYISDSAGIYRPYILHRIQNMFKSNWQMEKSVLTRQSVQVHILILMKILS